MEMRVPQIVALGGGGFSMESGNTLMDDHVLGLAGKPKPKVCFIPTASGDADHYVVRFYRRFGNVAETSHVSLFRRDTGAALIEGDLENHLLQQDVIYVGGGSVLSMLGTWKAHGLDRILERCWRRGIIMVGPSAGSLCWFDDIVTAFHGPPEHLRGLGLLPYSNCVHYDAEPQRASEFRGFIAGGVRGGFGVDDGAAIHFRGTELFDVIASKPKAGAYHVELVNGEVVETALGTRYLGMAAPALVA